MSIAPAPIRGLTLSFYKHPVPTPVFMLQALAVEPTLRKLSSFLYKLVISPVPVKFQ